MTAASSSPQAAAHAAPHAAPHTKAARQARIVWERYGTYGCEFCSPMQAEAVEQLCEAEQRRLRTALKGERQGFGRAV